MGAGKWEGSKGERLPERVIGHDDEGIGESRGFRVGKMRNDFFDFLIFFFFSRETRAARLTARQIHSNPFCNQRFSMPCRANSWKPCIIISLCVPRTPPGYRVTFYGERAERER